MAFRVNHFVKNVFSSLGEKSIVAYVQQRFPFLEWLDS